MCDIEPDYEEITQQVFDILRERGDIPSHTPSKDAAERAAVNKYLGIKDNTDKPAE